MTEVQDKITRQIAEAERLIQEREDEILDRMSSGENTEKLAAEQAKAKEDLSRLRLALQRVGVAETREAVKSRLEAMKAALAELDKIEKTGFAAVKEIAGLLSTALVKMAALASVRLPTVESQGTATMPTEILCYAMRQEIGIIMKDVPIRDEKRAGESEGRLKRAGEEDVQRVISSLRIAAAAWIKESERLLAGRKIS